MSCVRVEREDAEVFQPIKITLDTKRAVEMLISALEDVPPYEGTEMDVFVDDLLEKLGEFG
jgi:hypothetical protein